MGEPHILVVEDETIARRVLRDLLSRSGYEVTAVSSGEEALEQLDANSFDLVLTDLQLRKVDGMQVVAAARERDPDIETIVLTGYATLDSAIAAVRSGTSNYILKPGRPGEIEQSVAAALTRRELRRQNAANLRQIGESLIYLAGYNGSTDTDGGAPGSGVLMIGGLLVDRRRHSASFDGRPLNLSAGEFALLMYLAQHHQEVIGPQQLAREVMGYQCDPHEARDLIKARIWALRRKLENDPSTTEIIVSVRGVGYMLAVK
jgi:DNA-binding response OmpR family regulator